jgi:hypothetical protein
MARNRLLNVRVYASRARFPVRWVAEDQVEAPGGEFACNLAEVHLSNGDLLTHAVCRDIFAGKLRKFGLDLDTHDSLICLPPVCEDEWYHAAACSQLYYPLMFLQSGKAREQDGVDSESIPFLFLANGELAPEKRIAGQRAFSLDQIISSLWTRGLMANPEMTFG